MVGAIVDKKKDSGEIPEFVEQLSSSLLMGGTIKLLLF